VNFNNNLKSGNEAKNIQIVIAYLLFFSYYLNINKRNNFLVISKTKQRKLNV